MSFYDEITQQYKADLDTDTGIPKSERGILDSLIRSAKEAIVATVRLGESHVTFKYKVLKLIDYGNEELHAEAKVYYLLDDCMNNPNYIGAWELLVNSLGEEFDIEVSFVNGIATMCIQWEVSEAEVTV